MAGHVFISYSHVDQVYVDTLVAALSEQHVESWLDARIDYGSRWPRVIKERVDSCAVFVVVMTPEAEESAWVGREIDEAEATARPILPLLLRGDRFFRLAEHQYESVAGGSLPSERWFGRVRDLAGSADVAASAPIAPRPLDAPRGPDVRVDAFGRGDFLTIAAAVEAVAPGTRIVVAPGLYRESFVVDRPVTLIGDGEAVVEARAPIVVKTTACRLQNLTLRRQSVLARGRRRRGRRRCVSVLGGHVELIGCDVSSDPPGFADCVSIDDAGSALLQGNRIHHGAICLSFSGGAGGIVEENDIFAASESGVWIGGAGTNPQLRKNSIHDNGMHGVGVWLDGRPTIEENEICRNGMSGVWLLDGAAPILRANRVFENPIGIEVEKGANGTIERNELYGNASPITVFDEGGHQVDFIDNRTASESG